MEPESQVFETKIDDIKNQFMSVLDDFKKYYIYYNKNPESNEFQNYYANSKSNLQTLNQNIFSLTNSIQKNIIDLDKENTYMNKQIIILKKKFEKMVKLQHNLEMTEDGSEQLINDSKELYNEQYHKNVILFLALLLLISLSYKTFSRTQVPI
jgi:hypothetical protein